MSYRPVLCDYVVLGIAALVVVAAVLPDVLIDSHARADDPPPYHTLIPGDFDDDGDVDLRDYAEFLANFSGPVPIWLQDKIACYQDAPPMNPPVSIYRYAYLGEMVYWRSGYCCDIPSVLYDANGNYICAPGGGIHGTGDENCPNWRDYATDETLIWQDER